jgi:hypothetical protein
MFLSTIIVNDNNLIDLLFQPDYEPMYYHLNYKRCYEIRYQKQEQIYLLNKLDERRLEAEAKEGEATTNGVLYTRIECGGFSI